MLPSRPGPMARQSLETGIITLMLGFLLFGYDGSPRLAVPESYNWLWSGFAASFSSLARGISLF